MKYYIFKTLVLGSYEVGKSSFLRTNIENFDTANSIGVSFHVIDTSLQNNIRCKLQIWDFLDRRRFRSFNGGFCRGAGGALIFFDLSDRDSFTELHYWVRFVQYNAGNIPIFIIANKSDLHHSISEEELENFIDCYQLDGYFYNSNVRENNKDLIWRHLMRKMVNRSQNFANITLLNSLYHQNVISAESVRMRLVEQFNQVRDSILTGNTQNNELTHENDNACNLNRYRIYDQIHTPNIMENNNTGQEYREDIEPPRRNAHEPILPIPVVEARIEEQNDENFQSLRDEMLRELQRLETILRGESVKLDKRIEELSNSEREILEDFIKFYSHCPICKKENHRNYLISFYFNTDPDRVELKESLLDYIYIHRRRYDNEDNPISIGIPCCHCYKKHFNEDIAVQG